MSIISCKYYKKLSHKNNMLEGSMELKNSWGKSGFNPDGSFNPVGFKIFKIFYEYGFTVLFSNESKMESIKQFSINRKKTGSGEVGRRMTVFNTCSFIYLRCMLMILVASLLGFGQGTQFGGAS